MSIIKDTFFGGAEKKAAKATQRGIESGQKRIEEGNKQAREDIFNLFPSAEANSQKGYQSALDVFGQFMPQQAQTFQQGNVAAQNQILAGMPQAHNALMGGQVDYSQFQPTQLDYDASMFQQQLPDYQTSQQALSPLAGMTDEQIQTITSMYPQAPAGLPQNPNVIGPGMTNNAEQYPNLNFTLPDFNLFGRKIL